MSETIDLCDSSDSDCSPPAAPPTQKSRFMDSQHGCDILEPKKKRLSMEDSDEDDDSSDDEGALPSSYPAIRSFPSSSVGDGKMQSGATTSHQTILLDNDSDDDDSEEETAPLSRPNIVASRTAGLVKSNNRDESDSDDSLLDMRSPLFKSASLVSEDSNKPKSVILNRAKPVTKLETLKPAAQKRPYSLANEVLILSSDDDDENDEPSDGGVPKKCALEIEMNAPYRTPSVTRKNMSSSSTTFRNDISFSSVNDCGKSPDTMDLDSPHARTEFQKSQSPESLTGMMRRKVPTPAIPVANEIGGKLYPDLRHQFILALIDHAKQNRRSTYQRCTFDASVRAITILSLWKHPIRSWEAIKQLKGVGAELVAVLKHCFKRLKGTPYGPIRQKFSSVTAAALVGLHDYEREHPDDPICSLEDLIPRINRLMDHKANGSLSKPIDYYLDKNTMDPGWQQVKKLCSPSGIAEFRQCIKERKNKKKSSSGICFELLTEGRENALALQIATQNGTAPVGPLRQLCADEVNEEYGNVTMVMDYREGGGGSHGLHKMCDLLDQHGIPYVVRELKISDYVFFVRNKLAPIIIERKTVDDVANSLADGRWDRQKRNMRKAQLVLGGKDRKCQMCYLIEGDTSKRIVHGGNVGRASWNQSSEDVENAINELPSLGFSVIRSKSHMGSVVLLAQVARDVSWKADNGSIDAELTYPEFLEKMKHVPEREGDPLTEARHQFPAAPVVDNSTTNQVASAIPLASSTATGSPSSKDFPSHDEDETIPIPDQASEDLKKLSLTKLKTMCKDRDEKQSGTKKDLIARLLKPRKPELLILRSKSGQYVPKVPSCNAALLVALLLNHRPGTDGLAKENIMLYAEETGISKEPIGGNGGWYDGWAGMKDMTHGDPALVCVGKGRKYSLTTQPSGKAGINVAQALHLLAHRENLCRCGNYVAT